MNDVREKYCTKFMTDDAFVKTDAFNEYVWRTRKDEFENKMKDEMAKSPKFPKVVISERVVVEMKSNKK